MTMAETRIEEKIIRVKNIHCESCAKRIEKKLSKINGIYKIKVNIKNGKVYISFDPAKTSLDEIIKEIEKMGYETDFNIKMREPSERENPIMHGIMYGLLPHSCCIGFVAASIIGATAFTQFFKQFLLNPYFFYILIMISSLFATISAIFYLTKHDSIKIIKHKSRIRIKIDREKIKRNWKYLLTLYGSTIGVNLLFFIVIFPLLVSAYASPLATYSGNASTYLVKLKVDIPCPGHAPLILQELKSLEGVIDVRYSFPNIFEVIYDSSKISKQKILALDVFKTYKAAVLEETALSGSANQQNAAPQRAGLCPCCGVARG